MNVSDLFNSISGRTPSDAKETFLKLFSSMPPERLCEHIGNLQNMAQRNGQAKEREEMVCRLLASDMTVEDIASVLCIRADAIRIIESNNATIRIPEYAKSLKERRRRKERQSK